MKANKKIPSAAMNEEKMKTTEREHFEHSLLVVIFKYSYKYTFPQLYTSFVVLVVVVHALVNRRGF